MILGWNDSWRKMNFVKEKSSTDFVAFVLLSLQGKSDFISIKTKQFSLNKIYFHLHCSLLSLSTYFTVLTMHFSIIVALREFYSWRSCREASEVSLPLIMIFKQLLPCSLRIVDSTRPKTQQVAMPSTARNGNAGSSSYAVFVTNNKAGIPISVPAATRVSSGSGVVE